MRAQKIYRRLQEILSVPWERGVELKDTGNFQLLPFCGENKTSMCYVWSNIKEKETQPVFCYLKSIAIYKTTLMQTQSHLKSFTYSMVK